MSSKNDLPTVCNTDESPTVGPALGNDCDDSDRPRNLGRRTFLKGIGVTTAAGLGVKYTGGPVGSAQAVAPLLAAGVVGGSVVAGWALREFEVIGADTPPEGLTYDALLQGTYESIRARYSNNASTFIDNLNILDGAKHIAYTDAKIAAIEQLNLGAAQSEVQDSAVNAVDAYQTTLQKNLVESWNESAAEFETLFNTFSSHPDYDPDAKVITDGYAGTNDHFSFFDEQITLQDGSTMAEKVISVGEPDYYYAEWSGFNLYDYDSTDDRVDGLASVKFDHTDYDNITYLTHLDWLEVWDTLAAQMDSVRDGLVTWVDSVYGSVQSGEIDIEELITPRERATMMADEEGGSQAIADLIALNIPVDLEREATITHGATGAVLRGSFGLTDEADGPLVVGETYDASTFAGSVYFTADLSLLEGEWSEYQTGVDGGTVTLTSEPFEATVLEVTTTADETVAVDASDWIDNGDGTWSYDASASLETAITEVASVRFVSASDEANYDTISLDGQFTVDAMENTTTGESATETSFTSSEPQTDSNYITQEEWDTLESQNQELIDKYEESQNSGGGLDLSGLDMFGIPGEIVAFGGAAVAAFFAFGNK